MRNKTEKQTPADAMRRYFSVRGDGDAMLVHLDAVLSENAALKADNAALVAAMLRLSEWSPDVPRPVSVWLEELRSALAQEAHKPHPGVALLERLTRLDRLDAWLAEQEKEAARLPRGAFVHGGPLHGASSYNLAMHVVRQAREALEKEP